MPIDRRALLSAAIASMAAACVACPPFPPKAPAGLKRLGDSHVHLFNAADLPVRGFLNLVIIPDYLAHIPEVALALVDAAVTVLKAMAPSAQSELRSRPADAAPRDYADRLATRIEASVRAVPLDIPTLRPESDVSHSYALLGALLRAGDPAQPQVSPKALGVDPSRVVDREFLARIAVEGRLAARADMGVRAALPQDVTIEAEAAAARGSDDLGALWDTLKWCYEMVVTRCKHVHDYLGTITTPDRPTEVIVNLLVDYDAWLGDSPSAGSAMHDQLLFWDRFSHAVSDRLEIHSFAGYDPLRHAEDRLAHAGRSDYWAALQGAVDGAVAPARPLAAGFKIYPPMGFQVFGNAGLGPKKDRSGALVRERWAAHKWDIGQFGVELDASLDAFFSFCAQRGIPVVAHGRHSQEASTGTGAFASPRYWFERAQWVWAHGGKPLRASIAHWTNGPEFREWAPRILELNQLGQADIYFDIAYTPEFLPGGDGKQFMSELVEIYGRADKSTRWLMFGSDWIMLGREPGADHYAQAAAAAIRSVPGWGPAQQDLVLHDNLRRFLEPRVGNAPESLPSRAWRWSPDVPQERQALAIISAPKLGRPAR